MKNAKTARDESAELAAKSFSRIEDAIDRLAYVLLRTPRRVSALLEAERDLGDRIATSQQLADLLGARRTLLRVDSRVREREDDVRRRFAYLLRDAVRFSEVPGTIVSDVVPRVPFEDAVADLLKRQPRLALGWEEVQRLYSSEHGFALAKSASKTITAAAQKIVAKMVREGTPSVDAEQVIASLGDWKRSYGETVYRTNVATAYANGQWRQATSPALEGFVLAIRREPVGDADTRAGHDFVLVARPRDPIWLSLGLPAGYNCRCSWEMLDVFEIEREGIRVPVKAVAPSGAQNDPGFTKTSFAAMGFPS